MQGLTVRWPLAGAPAHIAAELRDYVADASFAKFSGMSGLRFKTWRMREGEWFEGTYVFATSAAREEFETAFRAGVATAPVTAFVGAEPITIEPFEVLAVAEGWEGFQAAARYAD